MSTKIIIRVVAKDSKIIGSGVGGALVRIKNVLTGAILAQGIQRRGTGDTERIMAGPRQRGDIIYDTPGTAFFQAELPLQRPTQLEVYAEALLGFPHAIQKGSKTITLIPGKHLLGEGLIIELDGLIVNIIYPLTKMELKEEEFKIRAEVRML